MIPKIYLTAKRIHRFCIWIVLFLGLTMMFTGSVLKFSPFASVLLNPDLLIIRNLHNQISFWFSLTFLVMAFTGITMYFYPLIKKNQTA